MELEDFAKVVKEHIEEINNEGSSSRIEILYKFDVDKDISEQIKEGIFNTITVVQTHSKSYNFTEWGKWINFFVSALQIRLKLITQIVDDTKHSDDDEHTLKVIAEVSEPIAEICHIIKLFFSGRQFLKSTTLPCLSFMANRPTLTKLRKYTQQAVNNLLNVSGINLMETFYSNLNRNVSTRLDIPDYVKGIQNSSTCIRRKGYACNKCFTIFPNITENKNDLIPKHKCLKNKASKEKKMFIESKTFCENVIFEVSLLGKDQRDVFDFIISSTKNMFITGPAGTGKSYLMNVVAKYLYIKYGIDSLDIMAYTNQAAQNVNGKTIHSFLGADYNTDLGKLQSNGITDDAAGTALYIKALHNNYANVKKINKYLKFIILDEVSMITGSMLHTLHIYLTKVKECTLPFGGVRLFLVGDALQVIPVAATIKTIPYLDLFYYHPTFYDVKHDFYVGYLKEIFRQDQNAKLFLKALFAMRYGKVDDDDINFLNDKCGTGLPADNFSSTFITLRNNFKMVTDPKELTYKKKYYVEYEKRFAENVDFIKVNHPKQNITKVTNLKYPTFIACLENKEVDVLNDAYAMSFKPHIMMIQSASQKPLFIAIGMQVQITHKLPDSLILTKGSLAIIESYTDTEVVLQPFCEDNWEVPTVTVTKMILNMENKDTNNNNSKHNSEKTYMQFPIEPCIAGTTYSIQGLTFTHGLIFNNERSKDNLHATIGQGFVIFSRNKNYELVRSLHPLVKSDITAHTDSVRFDLYFATKKSCINQVDYIYERSKKHFTCISKIKELCNVHKCILMMPLDTLRCNVNDYIKINKDMIERACITANDRKPVGNIFSDVIEKRVSKAYGQDLVDAVKDFGGDVDDNFGGDVVNNFGGDVDNDFGGDVVNNFGGDVVNNFGGNVDDNFGGDVVNNFGGDVDNDFGGDVVNNFGGDVVNNFGGNVDDNFGGDVVNDFGGDVVNTTEDVTPPQLKNITLGMFLLCAYVCF